MKKVFIVSIFTSDFSISHIKVFNSLEGAIKHTMDYNKNINKYNDDILHPLDATIVNKLKPMAVLVNCDGIWCNMCCELPIADVIYEVTITEDILRD